MNYYFIQFDVYRSLGDGEHEGHTWKRLVKADSYHLAVNKLEKEYHKWMLSDFINLTIDWSD